MPKVTDEIIIRGHRIKNRLVMLPMVTFSFKGGGDDYYGRQHLDHYTAAAENGTGLIILQSTSVIGAMDGGGMWTPGSVKTLMSIAAMARAHDATVMMQLTSRLTSEDINDWTTEGIRLRQVEFKQAAIRACEMGFHGVEFHFAHGYTLCRFMDGEANRRADEFGGSIVNRVRILTDILPEIRRKTNDDFIVSVRMGEFTPTSQDGITTAQHLERSGIDLLNVSFGMQLPTSPVPEEFPFSSVTHSGYVIRQAVHIPVIGLYGIRTAEQATGLIEGGYVDMVGVGRGMLADPRFADKVLTGGAAVACFACKRCRWYTDHTKCPARMIVRC